MTFGPQPVVTLWRRSALAGQLLDALARSHSAKRTKLLPAKTRAFIDVVVDHFWLEWLAERFAGGPGLKAALRPYRSPAGQFGEPESGQAGGGSAGRQAIGVARDPA